MNIWNVTSFWMAGNKCIVHIHEVVKKQFFSFHSSLCNATDILQIYSTLQVVFIECLFLFIFFIHFSSFIQECIEMQHNSIREWNCDLVAFFFPDENYWVLNSRV